MLQLQNIDLAYANMNYRNIGVERARNLVHLAEFDIQMRAGPARNAASLKRRISDLIAQRMPAILPTNWRTGRGQSAV